MVFIKTKEEIKKQIETYRNYDKFDWFIFLTWLLLILIIASSEASTTQYAEWLIK